MRLKSWGVPSTQKLVESTRFFNWGSTPAELTRALGILGDMFSRPTFEDLEIERQIILEEALEDLDDQGRNINLEDISRRDAWGRGSLGFTIVGPLENIQRFTRQDILGHFQRFYGARNMVLCVAGPVTHEEVQVSATESFGRLHMGQRAVPKMPQPPTRRRLFSWTQNESAQAQIQLLFQGPALVLRMPCRFLCSCGCWMTGCQPACINGFVT